MTWSLCCALSEVGRVSAATVKNQAWKRRRTTTTTTSSSRMKKIAALKLKITKKPSHPLSLPLQQRVAQVRQLVSALRRLQSGVFQVQMTHRLPLRRRRSRNSEMRL